MLKKDALKEQLSDGCAFVAFYKKSGSRRDMFCTTNNEVVRRFGEKHLPKEKTEDEKAKAKPKPDGLFSVFDLEAEGWRSFWYDDKLIEAEPFDATELLKQKGV